MKYSLNKPTILFKIILPLIVCNFLLNLGSIANWLWGSTFVLIFAIVIVVFNIQSLKYNFIASIILSIIISYTIFGTSSLISSLIGNLFHNDTKISLLDNAILNSINLNRIFIILSTGVVSPILMLLSYNVLFKFEKDSFYIIIAICSIVLLFIVGLSNIYSTTNNSIPIIWQSVMILALQLILYRDKLAYSKL